MAQNEDIIDRLQKEAIAADAVVLAEVISVGPAPRAWSGFAVSCQTVNYVGVRVDSASHSARFQGEFSVAHPVVARSFTSDADEPMLNRRLFYPGARLVLFVSCATPVYLTKDENYGVQLASAIPTALLLDWKLLM